MKRMRRSVPLLVAAALAALVVPIAASASSIVFVSTRANGNFELYTVERDGSDLRRLTFNDIREREAAWSPDGTRIVFSGVRDGNWDLWSVDARGSDLRRLTTDPARDDYPRWTADGRIVFQRGDLSCPCSGWVLAADGLSERRIPIEGNVQTPAPAPHGEQIAYASDRDGSFSLYVAHLNGKGVKRVTDGPAAFGDFVPRWSPRGNDIAFLRDDNGVDNDVYVVHSSGSGLRRLTSTPERVEFFPTWNGRDEIVVSTFAASIRLVALSLADGSESTLSTAPRAPYRDDFEDGVSDASLWHQIQDPGSSLAEVGGRLVVSIAAGSTPGGIWNQVDAHYGSQCSLPGDYAFRVDYELLDWPDNGVYAALTSFFANSGISRQATRWGQQLTAWTDSTFAVLDRSDTAGSFRLVRTGGVTSAYHRGLAEADWTLVLTSVAPGNAVFGMGLWAPGWMYGGEAASVAFDDFELESGALACPSWWADFGADLRG